MYTVFYLLDEKEIESTLSNAGWPKNLEFDNLGKKIWSFRDFEKNLKNLEF